MPNYVWNVGLYLTEDPPPPPIDYEEHEASINSSSFQEATQDLYLLITSCCTSTYLQVKSVPVIRVTMVTYAISSQSPHRLLPSPHDLQVAKTKAIHAYLKSDYRTYTWLLGEQLTSRARHPTNCLSQFASDQQARRGLRRERDTDVFSCSSLDYTSRKYVVIQLFQANRRKTRFTVPDLYSHISHVSLASPCIAYLFLRSHRRIQTLSSFDLFAFSSELEHGQTVL